MMIVEQQDAIIQEFQNFIRDETYPCVAARAAVVRNHIACLVAGHMACPNDNSRILHFLYGFVNQYRSAKTLLHSAAVIFTLPENTTEEIFDHLLWQRLQALSNLDAQHYGYDKRVNPDPHAANFSFSLAEEAFFIIGLHPSSERRSRRFKHPVIVFNPHAQFEALRKENHYEKMKTIVRKRDVLFSGSMNPMLTDFGEVSEARQYSGREYTEEWICPLKVKHATSENNSSAQ